MQRNYIFPKNFCICKEMIPHMYISLSVYHVYHVYPKKINQVSKSFEILKYLLYLKQDVSPLMNSYVIGPIKIDTFADTKF